MGTNYYAVTAPCAAPCAHCGKVGEVHICKNLTSFQGWVLPYEDSDPDDLPLGVIRSWADWKVVLRSGRVTHVVDEYRGEQDVEAFIADVEATEAPYRRRQYDWMRDHYVGRTRPEQVTEVTDHDDWLDADGFSFCRGMFT